MRSQLARTEGSIDDRLHLEFALGKACEDAAQFAASFRHYDEANRLRRSQIHYSAAETTSLVERSRALYTREFFHARAGAGCPARDPVFIVACRERAQPWWNRSCRAIRWSRARWSSMT